MIDLERIKSSRDPLKYFPSVKTDIPLTPASSYSLATFVTESELLIFFFEGERRLNSAIIPKSLISIFFTSELQCLSKRGDVSK